LRRAQAANALVIHLVALLMELCGDPANPVKRLFYVDVHDFVLDVLIDALLLRIGVRLVVMENYNENAFIPFLPFFNYSR